MKLQLVSRQDSLKQALNAIDRSAIGLAVLVDADGRFERTVTDGDIRRLLLSGEPLEQTLDLLPAITSHWIRKGVSPRQILTDLNRLRVDQLPVLDADQRPIDVIHRRDLKPQILLSTPHLGDEERVFVQEAFDSNWIAPLGPNVDAFEAQLAELSDTAAACALSSGTAALHLGMVLLGVTAGDTVFVSDLTFVASVNPILYQGARPIFIDSAPDSWNMSPIALEKAFLAAQASGKMPRAVVVVNLYGQSADYDPILALCNHYGVPVLEDAAESLGATYKGKKSGSFGAFGCFSFNGNKIITTSGGGMLVSNDKDAILRARHLATQAREPVLHYEHKDVGYNYRLSNILAGVGRGQVGVLEERIARRREINDMYRTGLAECAGVSWMPEPEWSFSNRWLSAMVLDPDYGLKPDTVIARLADEMIEARPIWKPMHMQPIFEGSELFTHGATSCAKHIFETGLCMPSGTNMTDDDVTRIIDRVRHILTQAA